MKKLFLIMLSVLCIASLASLSYAEDLKIDGSQQFCLSPKKGRRSS